MIVVSENDTLAVIISVRDYGVPVGSAKQRVIRILGDQPQEVIDGYGRGEDFESGVTLST